MKKRIIILLTILACSISQPQQNQAFAEDLVLQAGVSLSDQVPKALFGTWKITSKMTYSNNPDMFNEKSIDFWNLSKSGDVITLTNPISGAQASVTVEDVNGNQVKFTHVTKNKTAKMTETPTLRLNGENFSGTDKIIVEKYKDGKIISKDTVIYSIIAEKISGESASTILFN